MTPCQTSFGPKYIVFLNTTVLAWNEENTTKQALKVFCVWTAGKQKHRSTFEGLALELKLEISFRAKAGKLQAPKFLLSDLENVVYLVLFERLVLDSMHRIFMIRFRKCCLLSLV